MSLAVITDTLGTMASRLKGTHNLFEGIVFVQFSNELVQPRDSILIREVS